MKKPQVSIIIPTFNETANIVQLIQEIQKQVKGKRYEIIVVDDHSPDGTFQLVKKSFRNSTIKAYLHQGKPELGDSILQGVKKAKGEIIIGMDADFNHDPKVISLLLKNLEHNQLVIASRFMKGGGMTDRYRYFTSLLFNLVLRVLFGFPIWDNTSGFYAIRKKDLLSLDPTYIYRGYGEYHLRLVFIAHKQNFSTREVPVFYRQRLGGVSKSKFWKMFVTYLQVAFQLYREYP